MLWCIISNLSTSLQLIHSNPLASARIRSANLRSIRSNPLIGFANLRSIHFDPLAFARITYLAQIWHRSSTDLAQIWQSNYVPMLPFPIFLLIIYWVFPIHFPLLLFCCDRIWQNLAKRLCTATVSNLPGNRLSSLFRSPSFGAATWAKKAPTPGRLISKRKSADFLKHGNIRVLESLSPKHQWSISNSMRYKSGP
jgi:hypothetical protein